MEGGVIFVYSFVAWIVITVFALLPKKLPVAENLSVYFCTTMLMASTFTALNINFNRILTSYRLDYYFCLEFGRFLIYPFLLLVFTNVYFTARSAALRWLAALIIYAALCLVHFSFKLLQIISFQHWNMLLSMLMLGSFLTAAGLLEKTFAYLYRKKGAA